MSAAEAAQRHPVRLRAVVTLYDSSRHSLFVQDETGGIYVAGYSLAGRDLRVGQDLLVEGLTDPGEFAPIVSSPRIRILGSKPLPEPRRVEFDELLTGREDSNWVETQGLVEAASYSRGQAYLEMTWGTHRFSVHLLGVSGAQQRLVDARIRVRGVCASRFNFKRQLIGIQIQVPSPDYIATIDPPQSPFRMQPKKIVEILQFSPNGRVGRERFQGVVVMTRPEGPTYVRDETSGLMIQSHPSVQLRAGDLVDVVGVPRAGAFSPFVSIGELRKVRSGPPPKASPVTADQALEDGYDLQLVEIDAYLLDRVDTLTDQTLLMQAGRLHFTAKLDVASGLPPLEPGSLLRLTGSARSNSMTFATWSTRRISRSSCVHPKMWWC
jgi:hypothetical protein